MNPSSELSRLFSSVRQAVIGTDGTEIIFANPTAKSAIGIDPTGKAAKDIIPQDILASNADNYICATTIMGRKASISVVKERNITLLFLDFIDNTKPALYITRHIISNLRNCTMGIKMSADRCFTLLDEGKMPSEKHTSIFYHYYYSLLRTLTQIDSADLLERGEMLFSPAPTDLVRLCSELTDTVSLLCADTGVTISFSTEESKLIAVVDATKIEQLLLNLFANSLQYTSAGNKITLSLQSSKNRIILSLDDDGEGIPQEVLSNIFNLPDDNYDSVLKNSGNGLGLYISFGIAQLHNGVLLIESREGGGTRVRVMLPSDENAAPKFNCPETSYRHNGVSSILTGLADVLPSSCFGPKYED
ncbi:MAG: sensor histidine kinase [Clostridiales bacterium]|jgi:signal transduction histidine kinase|nr:sensor histidine kinase [Clostridiales bacterium]